MQPLIIPSPEKIPPLSFPSTAGGGRVVIDNWLPPTGPDGFPYYIRAFNVHAEVQVDTDGSASVDAPDWWRFIDTVSIVQMDGVHRVNQLRGDQLRVALEEKCGVLGLKEHPDIAVSQTNAVRRLTFRVEFGSDLLYDGDDYELPVDLFARIELTSALGTADGLAVAGGVITFDSIVWRVEAEVVQHDYLLWPSVDELVAVPFAGTSPELAVDINARPMGLSLHSRGAGGGASLANLTTVHIPGIFTEPLKRDPDLLEHFVASRRIATGVAATDQGAYRVSSVFTTGRACPVLWAHPHEKVWTGSVVERLTIKTVQASAISGLHAIFRKGLPKNVGVADALARKYNQGRPLPWRVKTRDKTRRDPAAWKPANRAYLPMVAPLPGRSAK